jgi:tRNA-Thr(GGU) m(6)t(6)A37 methyltransferase TsaA
MSNGERELRLRPIGRVVKGRSTPQEQPQEDGWEEASAEIEIDPSWAEALDGIEDFSHIWIVWWLDRFDQPPASLRVHPEGREEMPLVGLFATRSPRRPCPIAMTAVPLLGREGGRLFVQGLDAFEGTPVLDIKPYLRRGDAVPDATMPGWLEHLWRIHDEERSGKDGLVDA